MTKIRHCIFIFRSSSTASTSSLVLAILVRKILVKSHLRLKQVNPAIAQQTFRFLPRPFFVSVHERLGPLGFCLRRSNTGGKLSTTENISGKAATRWWCVRLGELVRAYGAGGAHD